MIRPHQNGVSLIELILVTTVLSLASVPILGQFTQVAGSSLINEHIQTASQLVQERAEEILATRRSQGFSAVATGTTNDGLTGNFADYSRSVRVTESTSTEGCPTGANCKRVVITVNRDLRKRSEITFLVLDY